MKDPYIFRRAEQKDLLDIIRLLSEDEIGSGREMFSSHEIKSIVDAVTDGIQ